MLCRKRGCGAALEARIDRIGAVVFACPGCERHTRGLCLDCPASVTGKAWRCDRCLDVRRKAANALCCERNREARNARARRRYAQLPDDVRAAKLARKKAWREANVARVKMLKRKGRLAGTWGYETREKFLAAMRAQNARRAEERRAAAKEQAKYRYAQPSCVECGATVPYQGFGRPRLRCEGCVTAKQAGRRKAVAA